MAIEEFPVVSKNLGMIISCTRQCWEPSKLAICLVLLVQPFGSIFPLGFQGK